MTTKLRYPFNGHLPNADDEPWTKLDTIVEHLEDGEPIPRDLASWLGEAIRLSGRDPVELIRRLGLKRGRGKPAADPNAWFNVGKRICELEDFGLNPDEARNRHSVKSDPKKLREYGINPEDVKPVAIGQTPYDGMKSEAALDHVDAETFGQYSRSQLQSFRDRYRKAWTDAQSIEK